MRLFTAFEIDIKNRNKIAKLQDHFRLSSFSGSFVRKDNFHITLKFLGETDSEMITSISQAIDRSIIGKKIFIIRTGNPGYFKRRDGLILYLGILKDSEEIWSINSNLEEELYKTGFKKENISFTPHITLARRLKLKERFDIVSERITPDSLSFDISGVTLFESRREKGQLVYDSVYRADLR